MHRPTSCCVVCVSQELESATKSGSEGLKNCQPRRHLARDVSTKWFCKDICLGCLGGSDECSRSPLPTCLSPIQNPSVLPSFVRRTEQCLAVRRCLGLLLPDELQVPQGNCNTHELLPHPLPSVGLDFSEAPHELLICSRSPQRVFEEKHLPRTWEWPNEVSTAAGRVQTRKVSWLHAWGAFWGPRLYRVLGYGLWEGVLRNIFLEIRWC